MATSELLNAIPFDNEQTSSGLVDWIETQLDIVNKALELDDGLYEVDQTIWDFMKETTSNIPDLKISTRTESIVASVAGFFRSSGDDSA